MQPSHSRLRCRAPNSFTPATALWQHFVAPTRPVPPPRLSLSAPHGAQRRSESSGSAGKAHAVSAPAFEIRRVETATGNFFATKREASIAKNVQKVFEERQATLTAPERLLAIARAAYEAAEDYEGVVVQPMVHPTPVRESSLPWCLPQAERTMSAMDRLTLDIENFYKFARPSRFESIARKHLIEQVRSHVRSTFPNHVLDIFGSERIGIALATSDIDFRLVSSGTMADAATANWPPLPKERTKGLKDLQELYWNKLRKHKAYIMPMLRHARYPLIALQDRHSGIDVQIVLSNDTSLSREIMNGYMQEYPYLRQLYYVIKTTFLIRGLSDVFRGGFGSYSLFMMIVASIRHNPHPRNDAAGALVNFLKFWRDFDTTKQGVSVEPAVLYDKTSMPMTDTVRAKLEQGLLKPLPSYMLSLRDPADETNDLGRKGVAIKHVQATFRALLQRLELDLQRNTRHTVLGPLVGPSYMLNYARRRKVEVYGKLLMTQLQNTLARKAKAIREAENVGLEGAKTADKGIDYDENTVPSAREEEQPKQADSRNEQSRLDAKTRPSVLEHGEHGEAMASILGMPSVEEPANTKTKEAE